MMNKKQKLFLIFLSSFLALFVFSFSIFALEIKYPNIGGGTINSNTTFPEYVSTIYKFAVGLVGFISFAMLVWGGVTWMMSSGEPAKVSEARNKIFGALFGAVLLLGSYMILNTINPCIVNSTGCSTPPPPPPTQGAIYLIKKDGTKTYLDQDTPRISQDSNNPYEQIGFNSQKNPEAVYFYPEADYGGESQKVNNSGAGSSSAIPFSSFGSIRLLFNSGGIYLYSKINHEGNPFFSRSSISDLSKYNFNDIAKSARLNILPTGDPSDPASYYIGVNGSVFFTEPDYRGECGLALGYGYVNDLSVETPISEGAATCYGYIHPIKNGTLSSFQVFNMMKSDSGTVVFYDSIDCKGNKYAVPIQKQAGCVTYKDKLTNVQFDGTTIALDKNILSFEINGSYGVVLATGQKLAGKCQLFYKPSGTTCISTLKGSYVYDPGNTTDRVSSYAIVPVTE